ncbi:MAG: glycine cleavage system aminomethyltransferase GcvT [Gemmatimonadetes bacterium]|nr:glycine cleavage system aminomethyltransferase GcvT [Gemmatimonadota bacterium]
MDDATLKRTPLYRQHVKLNAKMVEFGGWEMPVQYAGIIEEHRAVRTAAGLFDVSHMGQVRVSGTGARDFLRYLAANDIRKLDIGRCQYSFLLNERGGTIDDMMVYRTGEDSYTLVVNASNAEKDWAHIVSTGSGLKDVRLENRIGKRALLAFQGPLAAEILSELTPEDVGALRFHDVRPYTVAGVPVMLAASGYTGENGFEIFVETNDVESLWCALLEAGNRSGAVPAGLGARDTLRLEASLALYGHELDENTSPLEANLGFAVAKTGAYIGSEAIREQLAGGVSKRLVMLEMIDKGIPRQGYGIHRSDGSDAGVITSGSVSPWTGRNIAMGFVDPKLARREQEVLVAVRNRRLRAKVVRRPYYRRPGS